jgi:hypothetical protein
MHLPFKALCYFLFLFSGTGEFSELRRCFTDPSDFLSGSLHGVWSGISPEQWILEEQAGRRRKVRHHEFCSTFEGLDFFSGFKRDLRSSHTRSNFSEMISLMSRLSRSTLSSGVSNISALCTRYHRTARINIKIQMNKLNGPNCSAQSNRCIYKYAPKI